MRKLILQDSSRLAFLILDGWWLFTAVLRTAINFGINLIIYGEDGEVEYGGNPENIKNPF